MKNLFIKNFKLALIIAFALVSVACDSMTKKERAAWGAAAGAVIGGVIGKQIDPKRGVAIGAVVGGVAGGSIGYYMDSAQEKLEKDLAKSGITVTRIDKSTIKLNMPSGLLFGTNRSDLSPQAATAVSKVADTLQQYKKTAVMVEGHADSQGKADYNMRLSQRRADSVGNQFLAKGVIANRVLNRGHGINYPVASNETAQGRAQNRRVEVFVRAVEKGKEQEAFTSIY